MTKTDILSAQNREAYLRVHADCMPVKGATRSVLCDLTRNELIFFPSEYYEVLEYLTSDKIGPLLEALGSTEEKDLVLDFILFLDQHELITFLKDPACFPPIAEGWDIPAVIHNAIIDVDALHHDFGRIFGELDALGCQYVQIRSFSALLQPADLYPILAAAQHKSIQGVEVLLRYHPATSDADYIQLVEDQPILSNLTIHGAPAPRTLLVDYGCDEESGRYIRKQIHLVTQNIDSQQHCGVVTVQHLNAPTVENFFETRLFNGCLNRKVAVDAAGEIRNCPSMAPSYGNIRDTSLPAAIKKTGFQDKWHITKDQIDTCRDCEFRYVCSDCRAYLENPKDPYSKPLKCGYNPYTAEWEEWSRHPGKQDAIAYYGLREL
jgi:SPASM domain peptide maturase of grasp-with-spasm system